MALTEDNKQLAETISSHSSWLSSLIQLKESEHSYKAVAACGVLHNIFGAMEWFDHNTPLEGASDATLIPVLVHAIESASDGMDETNGDTTPLPMIEKTRLLALELIASIATSLQEALEHGATYEKEFEGFEEDDLKMEGENADGDLSDLGDDDGDENDEMTQEEIEADMDMVTGDDRRDESPVEQITLERLVREAAPIILSLARPSQEGSQTGNDLVQFHAVSALNNIAWTISSIDFSATHLGKLKGYWSGLAQRIWNEVISTALASNTADVEVATSITSLAWAVARSSKGLVKTQADEHRKFMSLYQASKGLEKTPDSPMSGNKTSSENNDVDEFQGLGVKCIGVLGSLALDPAPVELNREIGVFILTVLAGLPEVPAADTVEALNQIFDIYADKEYDYDEAVFWKDGFYKHLEDISPKSKKMAKAIDKRKHPELRARADEANLNLTRFLKYKRAEKNRDQES